MSIGMLFVVILLVFIAWHVEAAHKREIDRDSKEEGDEDYEDYGPGI